MNESSIASSPYRGGQLVLKNLKASNTDITITEEVEVKKKNLGLISKVNKDNVTDYQLKLKNLQS